MTITPSPSMDSMGRCVAMASSASGAVTPASSTFVPWIVCVLSVAAGKLVSAMTIFCAANHRRAGRERQRCSRSVRRVGCLTSLWPALRRTERSSGVSNGEMPLRTTIVGGAPRCGSHGAELREDRTKECDGTKESEAHSSTGEGIALPIHTVAYSQSQPAADGVVGRIWRWCGAVPLDTSLVSSRVFCKLLLPGPEQPTRRRLRRGSIAPAPPGARIFWRRRTPTIGPRPPCPRRP